MDQLKAWLKDLSIKKSIMLYITAFAILALFLSGMTMQISQQQIQKIQSRYEASGERYYLTNEKGERLGEGVIIGDHEMVYSFEDEKKLNTYQALPNIMTPIYSFLCIFLASMFFYRNKLKEPIAELSKASEKIAQNDLDFVIEYESKDELGQLCKSYEVMRSTLSKNMKQMWNQMEERKQLNAAFAHDLRTPLTVLKGYDEMLLESEDPTTQQTALTMSKNIQRLEDYVESMSNLYRFEDVQPTCLVIDDMQAFLESFDQQAQMLCEKQGLQVHVEHQLLSNTGCLDESFVSQVFENVLSNAMRYATSSINITWQNSEEGLLCTIQDDGPGFMKSTLQKGLSPYFTSDKKQGHFGLGLYICKILCEHHDGSFKIENVDGKATVHAYFKHFDL